MEKLQEEIVHKLMVVDGGESSYAQYITISEEILSLIANRPPTSSPSSDGLDGPFIKAHVCVDCGKELTWQEKMYSLGCCPYCGHTVPGTIVETNEFPKRQPKKEKATLRERWKYFKAMFMMW